MTDMFLVGGAVRDKMLGLQPKDYDFTVVAESYNEMVESVRGLGGEIFLAAEEYGTVRASLPAEAAAAWLPEDYKRKTLAADFVLARRDGFYGDGRRPDTVEPGSLYDDLARRDFTMNAMALSAAGILIDPFGGKNDLENSLLRAVGNPTDRLTEDALRAVRAIRFAVTKGFNIDSDLRDAMSHANVLYNLEYKISVERVREELHKAFKHDTLLTLNTLEQYRLLRVILLGPNTNLWLRPTLEER